MCGVSGFTGLGYLSPEIRYDIVEMLGSGIDKRGRDAAGCVVVPVDDNPPRLMRKLGTWDSARGRFLRAASSGHSVMMHSRYATHGSGNRVENAHPFAVKRKDENGKEFTVLYGCHNGVLWNAEESAKRHGRTFTVDSLEFFELLADKAYETITALSGYGVVTWITPGDRRIRVLRLSSHSDFECYKLAGGGLVWGSTKSIVEDALRYVDLWEGAQEVKVPDPGKVYLLSGDEARETKVQGLSILSGAVDRRTSGHAGYYGNVYGGWGDGHWQGSQKKAEDACWVCGNFYNHDGKCGSRGGYHGNVIESESIAKNYAKWQEKQDKAKVSTPTSAPMQCSGSRGQGTGRTEKVTADNFAECVDGTYRPVDSRGVLLLNRFPIYVKERVGEHFRLAYSLSQAEYLSGSSVQLVTALKEEKEDTKPSLSLVGGVGEPDGHNGHWSIPQGLTREEELEWLQLYERSPQLAMALLEEEEDLDEQLAIAMAKEGD